MAWFDSEIPEAQLASSSACAVNLSTARSQSFTAPGASSDWNCISNVHGSIDLQLTCLTLSTYNVSSGELDLQCVQWRKRNRIGKKSPLAPFRNEIPTNLLPSLKKAMP